MKVKQLFSKMVSFSDIQKIDVRFRLKTIDELKWPDAAPYRGGCKYDNATLNSFTIYENGVLRIDIEDNY